MSDQLPESPAPPTPATVHVGAAGATPAADVPDVSSFGRVDDEGCVFVRTRDGERQVGQWPTADKAAALEFYTRRYHGLVLEVDLLQRRLTSGAVSPDEANRTIRRLQTSITEAQAVGDLDELADRVAGLQPLLAERRQARRAEREAELAAARAEKAAIADEAEQIAAGHDWRSGPEAMRALLDRWKAAPHLDKSVDDELWRRLSAARTAYTRRRKQHFGELSEQRDQAKAAKERLIAEAEGLSTSTDWGVTSGAYRDLMARWKSAGSASRDDEERLWKRFRAAQDTFFQARDEANARTDAEYGANAEVKRGLLAEAERLLPVTDPRAARAAYRQLAERWDQAGRVPRAEMHSLESGFKTIDQRIREAEDDAWSRTSPEVHARASETVTKLEQSIAALKRDLATAEQAGDGRAVAAAEAAIAAREEWLAQARRSASGLRS